MIILFVHIFKYTCLHGYFTYMHNHLACIYSLSKHVYMIIFYVYIFNYTYINNYLACVDTGNYLARIHNRVYMYTYLSSHVCIIRWAYNTYVRSQVLHLSQQHSCWDSYQIAKQVVISTVNIWDLWRRGCGGMGCFRWWLGVFAIMACRLFVAKLLSKPLLGYCP